MKFRAKLAVLSAALILSEVAFSINCPILSDIQAQGITNAKAIAPQIYAAYELSQYNTGFDWAFIMGHFKNVTQLQAITNGNLVLSTMAAPGVLDLSAGRIVCRYDTGQNYIFALAVRDIFQITPITIKQYLQNSP